MAQPSTVLNKESGTSALNIALHPLVIINISDHYTRSKVQNNIANPRVIGALLGIQTGRHVEVFNSFELVYNVIEGAVVLDKDYLKNKQEQFRKVFPKYDFLGWYSTGDKVTTADIEIQKQVIEHNESPLYLLLDTLAATHSKDLPISLFESELHIINDLPTMIFVKVNYKIETGEAERISVDHVARVNVSGGAQEGSMLTTHLSGIHNAIKMLNMRVSILGQFVEATKKEQIPKDHALLRQIAALCNLLPAIDSANFKSDFLREYNDALLVTYLASITKGDSLINELVDKANVISDRHGRRRFF